MAATGVVSSFSASGFPQSSSLASNVAVMARSRTVCFRFAHNRERNKDFDSKGRISKPPSRISKLIIMYFLFLYINYVYILCGARYGNLIN